MLTRANRTTSLCASQPEVIPMRADIVAGVAAVMLATATGVHADDLTI
jgi:hypothetical protein